MTTGSWWEHGTDEPTQHAESVAVAGPVRIIGRDEADRWIDARRSVVGYETWDNQLVHTVAYLWRLIDGFDPLKTCTTEEFLELRRRMGYPELNDGADHG